MGFLTLSSLVLPTSGICYLFVTKILPTVSYDFNIPYVSALFFGVPASLIGLGTLGGTFYFAFIAKKYAKDVYLQTTEINKLQRELNTRNKPTIEFKNNEMSQNLQETD